MATFNSLVILSTLQTIAEKQGIEFMGRYNVQIKSVENKTDEFIGSTYKIDESKKLIVISVYY